MSGSTASKGEEVTFSRPAHLPGLEMVATRYRSRSFPRHVHAEYVVGAMTLGAEALSIRGRTHIVGPGEMILIEPGEPHSNCAAGPGAFGYAVMYIPLPLMMQAVEDLGGPAARPAFRAPTAARPALYRALTRTHATLGASPDPLEQETAFLLFLSQLLGDAQVLGRPFGAGAEHGKVGLARAYLDSHFRDGVSLRRLAAVTGLSPYYLLRSFKAQVGLPPAAYQTHLRIAEARRLLRAGQPIAEVAADVGFADQSHLTRHFQRLVGASPARYARQ